MSAASSRVHLADLTSGIGALVLGFGLGLLSFKYVSVESAPIIVVGILMHAWGMYDKRRLEQDAGIRTPTWSKLLYWICWLSLTVIAILLGRGVFSF